MADKTNPNNNGIANFLPRFYRSDANKKFLQATVEQLVKPGKVKKINGYVGRKNSKATKGEDIFVSAADSTRQNYQLEPALTIEDNIGNTSFFKDYQDYINQLGVFGSNTGNHSRLNKQEFYAWNPHIDWDKFVNFQQYYWLPYGPDAITIYGQQRAIQSTFTVKWESNIDSKEFLFTPNGVSRNPAVKLYRGQTYTFEIDSPGEPFSIKTSRSTGPLDRYTQGKPVDNFAVEQGTVTFTVPDNAPDVLFYVSENDINLGGTFQILDIKENTAIDVDAELLGKKTYKLPSGLALSNGMKVRFAGNVTPESYATGQYYIEGVGTGIKLVPEQSLELIFPYTDEVSILFDDTNFDEFPFGAATTYAGKLDYVVINRASKDRNPWSRYNRWFHQDVITASAEYNGNIASLSQTARAVRPIIEFEADLKLYNFGLEAGPDVDLIDNYTTDIFSTIEGTVGYNVDGVDLIEGQRILFTADTDSLANNKIYRVTFINVQDSIKETRVRQLHLVLESEPTLNQVTVVRQGEKYQGSMFWFDGTQWIQAQNKTSLNQPPLFDLFDENGYSFSDTSVYDGSTFTGNKLFSYKVGTGVIDKNLGFALSYKNINNSGDIVFNFNAVSETFQYKDLEKIITKNVSVGFLVKYLGNDQIEFKNGWETSSVDFEYQPALRIYKDSGKTNNFDLDIFDNKALLNDLKVKVYVNSIRLDPSKWSIVDGAVYKKIVLNTDIGTNDVLTIKAFARQPINSNGFYEIPVNLQNNPLNDVLKDFTLGEVIDHVNSIVDNLNNFSGAFPGNNNLRDLGNISVYGTKFVQHSGPMSLALYHITSPENNIVKAIEKARDEYGQFKRSFINIAETLGIDTDTKTFVDLILKQMNKDKPSNYPYYFSDMVPYGSAKKTDFKVLDFRIQTYPLSQVFDLTYLSNKAVGVYLNSSQLLYEKDYVFDDQGFVKIIAPLAEDDTVTIYEYDSTDGAFIPPTPTKLGIWPKYEPKIYLDTSLVTPRTMIQGHDGSQVLAYNDYRDALLLELEKRIFNNIKVKYDTSIFDINDIIPSYNRNNDYDLAEFNQTLAPSFFKWTSLIDRDFTKPLSYDRNNSFTYNYRGQVAPDGREVPGYWRGIYRWMLDTDRPNICPWECLGFTLEPTWWTEVYGPAPYTCDNQILWNDLAEGIIREPGKPIERNPKYARSFLSTNIPVDEHGNLRSPLFSNFATGVITPATSGDFVFGDVSPIEAAWRRSSYYPFSVLLSAMLLKPAKTFGLLLDRSRIVRNLTGQLVYKDTGLRVRPQDIVLPNIFSSSNRVQTAGLINYIVDFILSDNLKSYDSYNYDLNNISFKLAYRIGGFTSKEKFNLLLDSKNPTAVGGVFVPQENYRVVLNSSSPVKKITYSGVIVTKLQDGFEVKGYSKTEPYFKYYPWIQSGAKINVGGISESYLLWSANQRYAVGKVVRYNNQFYRATANHTSTEDFNFDSFQKLAALPVNGGQDAILRIRWDRTEEILVPYGTKFRTIQEVVDFLLGYGEYLKDQGFVFDDFNNTLSRITNWETSVKEFLFWTTQNWSSGQDKWDEWLPENNIAYGSIVRYNGDYYRATRNVPANPVFDEDNFVKLEGLSTVGSSVISLSPSADKITINTFNCVVDDLLNQFNGYEIFQVDGTKIEPSFLNNYRSENLTSYTPSGDAGIFGATFFLVQKEQVVIVDNNTLFNDTIYNLESGYRQERIKVSGYVSTDWYGGFDVPGFIFDQATIKEWEPWTDYALGDTVKYKEFYYSAKNVVVGGEVFVDDEWYKLEEKPTARLVPNWNYKASQFEDFYSLDSGNFDVGQQKMAQHLIGYQKRQYLSNIIKDDVSEFKFYQGMIIEKGTQNSLTKLFDALSAEDKESLRFFEEWAVRVGQYGATSAFEEIEFILDESKFKNNPQGFELVQAVDSNKFDFIIRQTPNDVYLKPLGYNNNPWPMTTKSSQYLRTPGFVRSEEVKLVLDNISNITEYSPSDFVEGDYVWCAFENREWNVYRFTSSELLITDLSYTNKKLIVSTNKSVRYPAGTYVAIVRATGATGFYKIASTSLNTFTISVDLKTPPANPFTEQDKVDLFVLTPQRLQSIDDANTLPAFRFKENEKLWTDLYLNDQWAVWNYSKVYKIKEFSNPSPLVGLGFGRNLAIDSSGNFSISGTKKNLLLTFDKVPGSDQWLQRQTVFPPFIVNQADLSSLPDDYFGEVAAISPDSLWVALGSPRTSNAATINGTADVGGVSSGLTNQGVVSLYAKDNSNTIIHLKTLVSPDAFNNERFGSAVAFGNNELFISAEGNLSSTGCVYHYVLNDNDWEYKDTIVGPNTQTGSLFGYELSIAGSTLVISAPGSQRVYVYKKNALGNYILLQQINSTEQGFGETVAISSSERFIAVGVKYYDGTLTDQGKVICYKLGETLYTSFQAITSPTPEVAGFFGTRVAFMNGDQTLVIYSANADSFKKTLFDNQTTTFDNQGLNLIETEPDSGRVDIFDKYLEKFVFAESLDIETRSSDLYGSGFAVGRDVVIVGAPYAETNVLNSGKIYSYQKKPGKKSWNIERTDVPKPDVSKIKRAFLYNKFTNKLVTYLDVLDPIQGKIPGVADQEIKFKTFYDPATYSIGTSDVVVDEGQAWTNTKVGMLWWDLRRAKFIDAYGGDVVYRNASWNTLFDTASIDIYEWVESSLLPAEWDKRADTEVGLTQGISGTSLYGNTVYSVKKKYDTISQTFKFTYYFWVKNKKTIPNVQDRYMSAANVSNLIANPKGQGYKYIALTGSNSFSLVNVQPLLEDSNIVLGVQYWTAGETDQNIHRQWRLISEDENTSLPKSIETKWFDSLCGKDENNRVIPDLDLPPKLRYGVEFRPRQSMFVNRFEALKQLVERANSVLINYQIVNSRDITKLTSYDLEPSIVTGLYDAVVDTDAELRFASVSTVKLATIKPIVANGFIVGVDIIDPGNGYITEPYITVIGNGESAKIRAKINARGQITGIDILDKGRGYDENTSFLIRNYSVLVHSDSQALGRWSIYAYDPINKVWSRSQTQAYDTRRYWNYADWYATGVSQFSVVDFSVDTISEISNLSVNVGQLVKVRNTSSAGWLLLKKFADSDSIDWTQSYSVVGTEKGTIQLSDDLYNFSNSPLGFDGALFDGDTFDNTATIELRNILESLRDNIFVDDLKATYLELFFVCLRYVFSEQFYVDWAFKTSFVRAQHNVGPLRQKVTYNNDNLGDFEDYINEVKPYRTKIREFVSEYTSVDNSQLSVTDFDIIPVRQNNQNTSIVLNNVNGDIQATHPEILEYPWKHWLDNVGFEVTEIVLTSNGSGYLTPPVVKFEGGYGSGVTAKAFISNGKVNRVLLTSPGSGYLSAPKITIEGGLDIDGVPATAITKIGNSVVRSNLIKMKFDRVSQTYYITELNETATFTGTGNQLQFVLKWAPDVRIGKSSITVDGVDVLRDSYTLTTATSTTRGYTSYYGKLTFNTPPKKGSVIVINYIKDWALLNAADRVQYYYNPTTGKLGKDLAQLMTGIDYGGVIVTGLDFSVSSGWDSLPYFTDGWDAIDPTFDDYIIKAGLNSNEFTLPYIPDDGMEINIYHNGVRIDDPNFGTSNPIANPNATMQTFVGDGINSTITLPSIAVTLPTTASASAGDTIIELSDVSEIQVGSLLLSPDVIQKNTEVVSTTGIKAAVIASGSISGTTLTSSTLTPNYVGMKVFGAGVQPETYILSVTLGVAAVAEKQELVISGTASNSVTFLGSVIPTSVAGDSAAVIALKIVANRDSIISTWNTNNPTAEIAEINLVLTPEEPAGVSTTLELIYKTTEGDVGQILEASSSGITFSETTTVVEGISGSVATAQISVSQTVAQTTLTFRPVVEVSKPLLASVPSGFTLFFDDLDRFTQGVQEKGTTKLVLASTIGIEVGMTLTPSEQLITTPAIPTNTTVVSVDAVTNTVVLSQGISASINSGVELTFGYNKLFFRKSTSDGSIKPLENDYDTALSGGDLAYNSATGLAADDILIDGDSFVTPTTSPAPEEVVPGQITDAVAIKVFYRPTSGSAKITVDNYISNGSTKRFNITQTINSKQALVVKVNDEILSSTDFVVDYPNNTVELGFIPSAGDVVSLFGFGFNGENVLDIDYFIGNNTTTEFITKAPWIDTGISSLVYVNGEVPIYEIFKTDDTYEDIGRVGIRFNEAPLQGFVINYVIVQGTEQSFAITKSEILSPDGVKKTFNLTNSIGDKAPLEQNVIVKINQSIMKPASASYFTINKNRLNYSVKLVTATPYVPDITDLVVYADGNLLRGGIDYTVDLSGITVTINKAIYAAYKKKVLTVVIATDETYNVTNNAITFKTAPLETDLVEIISSYKHDVLNVQRTNISIIPNISYDPDSVEFFEYVGLRSGEIRLDRPVIDDSYVWITKNGQLLTPSFDYKLSQDMQSIKLGVEPEENDKFEIITYGSNIHKQTMSYMQFKDMLNRTHYKRLSLRKQTKLARDLNYYDTSILVEDALSFDIPNVSKNLPGVVEINGERIEYFVKSGNLLSQLRRGTLGTGVPEKHLSGSPVQDIGPSETIPYRDTTKILNLVSDGSNLLTVEEVPVKSSTQWSFANGFESSIPVGYGQSNEYEVFVGGYEVQGEWIPNTAYLVGEIVIVGSYTFRCVVEHTSSNKFSADSSNWTLFVGNIRLKKHPFSVHNVNIHPESPEGDVQMDPDFAVDGSSNEIRLTNLLATGTKVTVVKKMGSMWNDVTFKPASVTFDQDVFTLDNGNTTLDFRDAQALQNSNRTISEFLKSEQGIWPGTYSTRLTQSAGTFDNNDQGFDNNQITFDRGN